VRGGKEKENGLRGGDRSRGGVVFIRWAKISGLLRDKMAGGDLIGYKKTAEGVRGGKGKGILGGEK